MKIYNYLDAVLDPVKASILRAFYNDDRPHNSQDIANNVAFTQPTCWRHMRDLEKFGVLQTVKVGGATKHMLRDDVFTDILMSIIQEEEVFYKERLNEISNYYNFEFIEYVILYGDYAKKTISYKSPVELLILSKDVPKIGTASKERENIHNKLIQHYNENYGVELTIKEDTLVEFYKNQEMVNKIKEKSVILRKNVISKAKETK